MKLTCCLLISSDGRDIEGRVGTAIWLAGGVFVGADSSGLPPSTIKDPEKRRGMSSDAYVFVEMFKADAFAVLVACRRRCLARPDTRG